MYILPKGGIVTTAKNYWDDGRDKWCKSDDLM